MIDNAVSQTDFASLSREELEAELRRVAALLEAATSADALREAGNAALSERRHSHGSDSPPSGRANAVWSGRSALEISEERLALAFEASGSLGWWDWDIPGDVIFASPQFARMYGIDPALAAQGAPLAAFVEGIHPEDRATVAARITETVASGGEFAEEYRLLHADGGVTWVYARGRCYADSQGKPVRFPGISIDITQRKAEDTRKLALIELGDRLRDLHEIGDIAYAAAEIAARAMNATRAGCGLVDPANEVVEIQPDWRGAGTASLTGTHRFRDYGSFIDALKRGETIIIEDVATHPSTRDNAAALLAIGIRVLINVPIVEHGRLVMVMFVHDDKPRVLLPAETSFLRTVADRTEAAIGRVRAERQQQLLNRELSHRLKNTLAMVQAITTQTLRNATSIDAARRDLLSRIEILGRAHDVLLNSATESADLHAVVQAALAVHDDHQQRFEVSGPSLRIGPGAALSLSMMLHELATNAVKYGALSAPGGVVSIGWRATGANDEDAGFEFDWTERGGPAVAPPAKRGFGSKLIERGLAGSTGGKVQLTYAAEGVRCRFNAPLAGLAEQR